jgi:hypothetical protein
LNISNGSAKRQKNLTATVEEVGRQGMVETLKDRLDKLFKGFDVLKRAHVAIAEY